MCHINVIPFSTNMPLLLFLYRCPIPLILNVTFKAIVYNYLLKPVIIQLVPLYHLVTLSDMDAQSLLLLYHQS